MNDQYEYIEKPLTSDIDQELSTGQTDRKQKIIRLRSIAGIQITTLTGFMEWVQQFDSGSYLFRGIPNAAYRIEASAFRRPKETDRDFEKFLQINRVLISDARLQGYDEKDVRKLKDLEILAEFQHFGAATCLIDFTYNALVALWFACLSDSKTSQDSSAPRMAKSMLCKINLLGSKRLHQHCKKKRLITSSKTVETRDRSFLNRNLNNCINGNPASRIAVLSRSNLFSYSETRISRQMQNVSSWKVANKIF